MTTKSLTLWLAAASLAPTLAAAQTPPIKPGLWDVRSERLVDGKPVASPADAMKNMSPEVRAKMEAVMKQKGLSVGAGGLNRICFSKAMLDAGRWQGESGCKTDYGARTASSWKWHSVCPQFDSVTDGEAQFASAENYTVNATTTRTFRGESKTTRMTIKAKWLGADCGDLKPFDPKR